MTQNIHIISNDRNWMEQSAIQQLTKMAGLEGMRKAVGLPDLHPGKVPVGAVFITEDVIYPHIIGGDIGCGMSLFKTQLEKRKLSPEKLVQKMESISSLKEIPLTEMMTSEDANLIHSESLGTLGGGNHFAELQVIEEILSPDAFDAFGLKRSDVVLLVHSGSRIYGQETLDTFIKKYQAQHGLSRKSDVAQLYLQEHNKAVAWAARNRELVSYRMMKTMGESPMMDKLVDSVHNSLEVKEVGSKTFYIHRKGAAPADRGMTVIPGSRGSLTYLILPAIDTASSGYSIAHGAGRKWERSTCKGKLRNLYTKETIKTTKLKGRVICRDKELLYEEAPEAYKNIERVIESLVDAGLIHVVATLKPVITYKT